MCPGLEGSLLERVRSSLRQSLDSDGLSGRPERAGAKSQKTELSFGKDNPLKAGRWPEIEVQALN